MDEAALFGVFDEGEDVFYFWYLWQLVLDGLHGVCQGQSALENDAIGFVDAVDDISLEAATAESHDIQSAVGCRFAGTDGVRHDTL